MRDTIRASLKKQFGTTWSLRTAQIFTPPLFSADINKCAGLTPGVDAWQQLKMSSNVRDEHMAAGFNRASQMATNEASALP